MAKKELKKISQEELDEILEQHRLWVENDGLASTRADLSFHDLRGLEFPARVNLIRANLKGSNLKGSNLKGANLNGTNLKGANLKGANLKGVNFKGANLIEADLWEAKIEKTDPMTMTHLLEAVGLSSDIRLISNLEEQSIQQQFKINQLEQELQKAQAENNQSQEQQEKITELEKQLELAKQQEQELQRIKDNKTKQEQEIQSILGGNINEAHKALTNALTNTGEQITHNQKFSTLLKWSAVVLIGLDIVFVIAIPILILCGKFNDLLDKVGVWAILFFSFPALLILLIALSLLRHQKQLIAEIRHYSMLKHKIELYGGILKAAQYTASSVMQLQDSEAAKYIQETFNEIKTELLKSPNFDLNAQPHIFPEEGGNLVEMLKSITELLKISTEANKAIAESAKKATTSEK